MKIMNKNYDKKNYLKVSAYMLIFLVSINIFAISKSFAANYPLEIIQPQEGVVSTNRFYKAYPGLEYNVRIAAISGAYPYIHELMTAPSGMTINSNTGEIIWSNPTTVGSPHSISVKVTDQENSIQTVSWTITVATTGIYFVDESVPDGGDGSINNPWNDWDDFYLSQADSTYDDAMIYFRSGTYIYPDISTSTAGSSNRLWLADHPSVYLAYPGETVIFNGNRDVKPYHLYTQNMDDLYFDGITFTNAYGYGIEVNGGADGTVVRRCIFEDFTTSGSASNQAGVCYRDNAVKQFTVVQDSQFDNFSDAKGIVAYGNDLTLFEDNIFTSLDSDGVALKSANNRVTVRNNRFGLGFRSLNMYGQGFADNCEINYNLMQGTIQIGTYAGNGPGPGLTYIYRNTVVGGFLFRYIEADDGPIHTSNNIIINSTPADHIRDEIGEHYSITANKSVLSNNLLGFPGDNIIDANGNLTAVYSPYRETHGHSAFTDILRPLPPSGLRIQ